MFPVVTGHGEERAFPVLLGRIIRHIDAQAVFSVMTPWRCRENQLLSETSTALESAIRAGVRTVGTNGAVIVLLDCEDQCPGQVGPAMRARAQSFAGEGLVTVVCAYREFETWFLWSLPSLVGRNGLPPNVPMPPDPDTIRGAKEWIGRNTLGRPYSPTVDQAAFVRYLDIDLARRSDSFDKLYREVESIVRALHQGLSR